MRATRLISMLVSLQVRQRMTAAELATEFGICERSVYRDMAALEGAGVPLVAERGPQGGFRLLGGYRTRLTGLRPAEAEALPLIGLASVAEALGLGTVPARTRDKLLSALPDAQRQQAESVSQRFHVDPVDWYRRADTSPHLHPLVRALLDNQAVIALYRSWTNTRRQRLLPLGLVLKGGAWYLIAQVANTRRTYRVNQIETLTVLNEHFRRPKNFDLPRYWAQHLEDFERRLRCDRARLRLSTTGLTRLRDLGAHANDAIACASPADGQGWVELVLPIEPGERAVRELLSLGPECQVIEPLALRRTLVRLAAEIARVNAGPVTGAPGRTRTGTTG